MKKSHLTSLLFLRTRFQRFSKWRFDWFKF